MLPLNQLRSASFDELEAGAVFFGSDAVNLGTFMKVHDEKLTERPYAIRLPPDVGPEVDSTVSRQAFAEQSLLVIENCSLVSLDELESVEADPDSFERGSVVIAGSQIFIVANRGTSNALVEWGTGRLFRQPPHKNWIAFPRWQLVAPGMDGPVVLASTPFSE